MKKKIFTFWEPTDKIPGYIKLCIETWKKFLGDEYEIIILNYSNLHLYLEKEYPKILYDDFTLPKQADAIRCAVLKKWGGIWLDADTLFVNDNFKKYAHNNFDTTLVGYHLGIIIAKPNTKFLNAWQKKIWFKLKRYKIASYFIPKKLHKRMINWTYFANGITDPLCKKAKPNEFNMLDQNSFTFPENIESNPFFDKNNFKLNYINYYFKYRAKDSDINDLIKNNQYGFIYLHHSWTPEEYKKLSEEEFLNNGTTLGAIFNKVLFNK